MLGIQDLAEGTNEIALYNVVVVGVRMSPIGWYILILGHQSGTIWKD